MLAGVVGAGADGDEASVSVSFDAVGADGVRSNHHAQVVSLQELIQVVKSKVNNVILLLGISHEVMLKTLCLLALMWIRPKQIYHSLVVLRLITSQLDLEWSGDCFNAFDVLYAWADASMATEDLLVFVLDDGGERHLFESFVKLSKSTVWIVDVFS